MKSGGPKAISAFLLLTPLLTSLFTLKLVSSFSKEKVTVSAPRTGSFFRKLGSSRRFPISFFSINALLRLPGSLQDALLVSDIETNEIYYVHRNLPAFASPLERNADGANVSDQAALLRRPGVAGMSVYQSDNYQTGLLLSRNVARDIALVALESPTSAGGMFLPKLRPPVTIVDRFNGSRLNAPHSIHVDGDGNVFFSDPNFGLILGPDEFDRAMDAPTAMEQQGQHVYYIPGAEVRNAIRTGVPALPRLLLKDLDRPVGIAVIRGYLFVAVASPRRPILVQYKLGISESGEFSIQGAGQVLYDWSRHLPSWGERWFSGVLGHLCVVNERYVIVGAGDGVAVFDVADRINGFERIAESTPLEPIDWIGIGVQPGPPNAILAGKGKLLVSASDRILEVPFDA